MTSYEDDHETLKSVLKELMKKNESYKWTDKNTLTFKDGKKEIGTIVLNDKKYEATGDIDTQVKELKAIIEDMKKKPIKADDLKDTPFEGLLELKSKFGGVFDNRILLGVYNKKLKSFGIEQIKMGGNLNQTQTISNKLTMAIETIPYSDNSENLESGYANRLKAFLKTTYETDAKTNGEIYLGTDCMRKFMPLEKEKVAELKIDNTMIGYYYPERNFIQLFFNPFTLKKAGAFDDMPHLSFSNILAILKENDVKKFNVDALKEKLFVSEFMKHSRTRLKELTSGVTQYKQSIKDYENQLRTCIEEMSSKMLEADYIKSSIESNGAGLFQEIEESKKLPFITSVEIDAGSIVYKFKPTYIPVPNMKKVDYDEGYGKRYLWLGAITFRISSTEFRVNCDTSFYGHGHPHASSHDGAPCFGSGEGRNKIYEALAGNRFKELAKLLWFWIKTYRNEGAYVKVWDGYDDVLKHGYPIFDEKGTRIEINEPDRIKSGEQRKLTKADDYEDNHKKFLEAKLEL